MARRPQQTTRNMQTLIVSPESRITSPSAFIIISYYPIPFACAFLLKRSRAKGNNNEGDAAATVIVCLSCACLRSNSIVLRCPLFVSTTCWERTSCDSRFDHRENSSFFFSFFRLPPHLSVRNLFGGHKWWMICTRYVYDWDDLKIKMIYVAWYAISIQIPTLCIEIDNMTT